MIGYGTILLGDLSKCEHKHQVFKDQALKGKQFADMESFLMRKHDVANTIKYFYINKTLSTIWIQFPINVSFKNILLLETDQKNMLLADFFTLKQKIGKLIQLNH